MTNVMQKTRASAGQDTTLNTRAVALTLKATTSLFVRLLVIARSSRENVDMEEMIGVHECSYMSKAIMAPDRSIHPSTDISIMIKLLDDLAVTIYIYIYIYIILRCSLPSLKKDLRRVLC